jgi:hypothetical protein
MGLFGGSKSTRTTQNIDNRTVLDQSGSTFDHSVDSSTTDNSYTDASQNFADNSYTDNSLTVDASDNSYSDSSTSDSSYHDSSSFADSNDYTDSSSFADSNDYTDSSSFTDSNDYTDSSSSFTDNSYLDTSSVIDGEYAGNTGSIQITDGGAFTTVDNAVSKLVSLGQSAIAGMNSTASISLATMGKTADTSMQQASLNNEMMRDLTTTALEQMSEQAASTVSSSTMANRDALNASSKLMTTISANGNDLLIDGVVNIAKYGAIGLGVLGFGFLLTKLAGGNK